MNSSSLLSFLGLGAGAALLSPILSAAAVFIICLIAIKLLTRLIGRILDRSNMEKGARSFVYAVIKVVLWAITIIIVADSLGIPVASLVATLSVVGLALSLSVQNILTNLFSGFTILLSRPFSSGDYVAVGGVEGTVREIGLFHTTLTTGDNKLLCVPNGEITSSKISNYSCQPLRRVDIEFPLPYSCASEEVKAAMYAAMQADGRILSDPAPAAHVMSYKDGGVSYILRAWVNNSDYWGVFFSLNESVRAELASRGINMAAAESNLTLKKAAD